MGDVERRTVTLDVARVEKRADDDGGDDSAKIVGHAAVFDEPADIAGLFVERVAKGAFTETVKEDDIRALFNHNPDFVLGRNISGTLRLKEDDTGLAIEVDPPDTQVARDLMTSMERGDVSQMSFGFMVEKQTWEDHDDGTVTRTLDKVRLLDVSPVTFPAYPQTDVAVRELRSHQEHREEQRRKSLSNREKQLELAERQH